MISNSVRKEIDVVIHNLEKQIEIQKNHIHCNQYEITNHKGHIEDLKGRIFHSESYIKDLEETLAFLKGILSE